MEGVDIYRLMGACLLVVAAWMVQVVGFSMVRVEVMNGPPKVNVVDFEKDFSDPAENRTLVELADERGWDLNADFVTPVEAERRLARHQRRKWLGLLIGLAGSAGTLAVAYRMWHNWLLAAACVLVGPVGVAFGLRRSGSSR